MILALLRKQNYVGLGSIDMRNIARSRDMRKTKQRSWISNSGLGLLNYQKTIFTGLGSLDISNMKFRRSWIPKSSL